MTVTGARISRYSAPFERRVATSFFTHTETSLVFCELYTSSGATGVGWTHGGSLVATAAEQVVESVIGLDEHDTERLWSAMYQPKQFGRAGGSASKAMAIIDIAAWDSIGRQAGVSVSKLVGGFRDRVPAYMTGGYYVDGEGLDELQTEVSAKVDLGARALKMKIGALPIPDDLARIDAVREAVGPDVKLLVDANSVYTRLEARRLIRELEQRDIFWLEEPLAIDDLRGAAELVAMSDVPIALGENEYSRFGVRNVLESGSADVLNVDAQIACGITEWRKCATIAEAWGIPMAPHGDQEVHVHLVSAVPNGLIVEYYDNNLNTLKDTMFEEGLRLNPDGTVSPPPGPGLGFTVDFHGLSKYVQSSERI